MKIFNHTTEIDSLIKDLENTKLHNEALEKMNDELHGFRHDFNNIMQAFSGYIANDDMKGLKTYFNDIFFDIQQINNLNALSPKVINNPAIYSIVCSKYNKAISLGIHMNINVFLDLNELNMKIYEFSRILGILLDNAIEASMECDNKIINVEFRKDTINNRQLLIIENTYLNKDINTKHIFEKGFSSKPHNTGFGLWEIKKLLKRNTSLNLLTTYDCQFFRQQLEIYNKINESPSSVKTTMFHR